MRKILLYIILIYSLILCSSCKNKEVTVNDPDYTLFYSNNTTEIPLNADLTTADHDTIEHGTVDHDTSNHDTSDHDTADHNTADHNNEDHNNEDHVTVQEEWPYKLEFHGVTMNQQYNTAANLNTNYKISNKQSFFICPDEDNQCIYYINYGKDNYIYQLKDGISTLLVEKEAVNLQLWNGDLYFIHPNENIPKVSGDIYSYNLVSQELKIVYQAQAFGLYIDSFGIFFNKYDENLVYNGFFLEFSGNSPEQVDYVTSYSIEEYQIITSKDGIYLRNSDTKEDIFLAPFKYINEGMGIGEQYFIFTDHSLIYTLNLSNGEKKIFNLMNHPSVEYAIQHILDYVVIDNKLYATDGGSVFIIDMEDNSMEVFNVLTRNMQDMYLIGNLYSDGHKIYALISVNANNTMKMVELTFTENDNETIKDIIITKELGE